MTSQYSVIQYLPDPATDERINFGVIAFGAEETRAKFVRNWGRIGSFGGPDISFLKEFARQVEEATSAQPALPFDELELLNVEALHDVAGKWVNSIQLTSPRASTLQPSALVDEAAQRFLRERIRQPRAGRDRRAAAGLASRNLLAALKAEGSRKPEKYVHRNEVVQGALDDHDFDVALVNGSPKLGVLAMSFEVLNRGDLAREISANAWTIDDVVESIPVSVVALPPQRRSKTYDHAVDLFRELGAEVVVESEVRGWAEDVAQELYGVLVTGAR
jgi:hypothetical protein